MSQLLKHYFINRETGSYATDTKFGLMVPSIEGLEIIHQLIDENEIPFCLSTCPDTTVITEQDGLQIINQGQWDAEVNSFDLRQEQKRYNIIREIRDEILFVTDWIVTKYTEQLVDLDLDFKNWRQTLRDLPNGAQFPTGFPTLPSLVENDQKVLRLYGRWNEVYNISMVNDPLPPLPTPSL